jgi:hypothetical protein
MNKGIYFSPFVNRTSEKRHLLRYFGSIAPTYFKYAEATETSQALHRGFSLACF